MSGAVGRENEIFDTLQAFNDANLEFIVVGGYGVSAFQHRFSVDADLVIRESDLDRFVSILEDRGYEMAADRDLVYGGRYLAFEKNQELPVTIDLLVNSLQCRQTDARWSFDYLRNHSTSAEIRGTERSVSVAVAERELQIAVKLHSGRLTDARDVVALAEEIDDDRIHEHLDRGEPEKLREVLSELRDVVQSDHFQDAFKGVFAQGELPHQKTERITGLIDRELERMGR